MTPQVQFDAQAQFVRGRALLVQPCRIELQDPAGDVDQGVTAPAGQRAPQRGSRLERGLLPLGEVPLVVELQEVELIRGQVDLVAAAPRADHGAGGSARGEHLGLPRSVEPDLAPGDLGV